MANQSSFNPVILKKLKVDRFLFAIVLLFFSMFSGISGFMILEDFTFSEALYMAVITFSTVGFNEIRPLSEDGRIFTSIYIIINLAIIAYVVSVVSAYLFEGELNKMYKRYLFNKEVRKMENHVIVCGFGRNGVKACEELADQGTQFVVLETQEDRIEKIEQYYNFKVIRGDATDDEVLIGAGIEKAAAIISTLPSDAQNVFLSLTARELNHNITIISRASEDSSEKKLIRAGATKVIMPDAVGGLHMAQHITKPVVVEYLDLLSGSGDYSLEEIHVNDLRQEFKNKSIAQLDVRKQSGVSIIGLKDDKSKLLFNPPIHSSLKDTEVLIIIGLASEIESFNNTFIG
ncbi:MAG: potassium channel protein [Reichenbachiella sp.]